jgi:hypothetical protein
MNDATTDAPESATDEHGLRVEDYTARGDEPIDWAYELEWIYDTHAGSPYEARMAQMKRLAQLRMAGTVNDLEVIKKPARPTREPKRDLLYTKIEERVEELNLAQLLAEPDEPIEWLWGSDEQGYIEVGSVGCLHAFGGSGKSMVMQALARSITNGEELLGMPCAKGRVLIIDAENPRREIKRRVKRLGLDPERTRYLSTRAPILETGFADWLYEEIQNHQADLLILDSQRGLWRGDEKEAGEVRLFYTELRTVADETGCAIVVIHHDNKGKDFSGSTDIDAAVDFRLHMTVDQKDEDVRFLDQAKMRGAKRLPKIEVVIRFEGFRLFVEKGDRNAPQSVTHTKKASAEDIAMFIRRQMNQVARPSDIRANFGISEPTLRSRRDELTRLGIRYFESGNNSVYHVSRDTPNLAGSYPEVTPRLDTPNP